MNIRTMLSIMVLCTVSVVHAAPKKIKNPKKLRVNTNTNNNANTNANTSIVAELPARESAGLSTWFEQSCVIGHQQPMAAPVVDDAMDESAESLAQAMAGMTIEDAIEKVSHAEVSEKNLRPVAFYTARGKQYCDPEYMTAKAKIARSGLGVAAQVAQKKKEIIFQESAEKRKIAARESAQKNTANNNNDNNDDNNNDDSD